MSTPNPRLSTLAELADQYGSDKGFNVLNAHGYTRVYESVLRGARQSPLRLLEIGLLHPALHSQQRDSNGAFAVAPSLQMWADYLPQADIFGLDIEDFSAFKHPRAKAVRADQGDRASLTAAMALAGSFASSTLPAGSAPSKGFDVIIDDGSHASHHQQISLAALFPHLNAGGVYIIEDLHYQPRDLELAGLTKTRSLLKALQARQAGGIPSMLTDAEMAHLTRDIAQIVFFDSLDRDRPNVFETRDALAVIQKR
jgi:hypothetical protein